jgi:biopolymer transport protein TolR
MARRSTIKPLQEISEINMTPLIDLTFLLLITFIITMPLVEQGIPINLPKGQAQARSTRARCAPITVDMKGQVSPSTCQPGDAGAAEGGADGARCGSAPDTTVMVRGDLGHARTARWWTW